jgi:flavorubredoxin
MEGIIPVTENTFWLGVNDYESKLFEAIWPLPDGISYNSYIILDDKIAVIDTVKHGFIPAYIDKIKNLLKDGRSIDYLVINHMEPDHSGAVKILLELFPEMQIIGNEKTASLLKLFYGLEKNIKIIKDNEELSLGSHKIRFLITPMVHWPETMMTYDETTKVLFSGDVFGGFGALPGGIFDDEVDLAFFDKETLRYFSNIIGKYSIMVQKAISHIRDLDIDFVASTHGPVFRKNPEHIIDLYDKWSRHETEVGVVLVYASMYGNTERMANAIANAVAEEHVKQIKVYNLSKTDISFIIPDIWRFKALIMGCPTYNTKLFPLMEHLIRVIENDNIANHFIGIFGSYGWSGGAVSALKEFAQKGNWRLIEPAIEAHCSPTEEDLKNCKNLGRSIARLLQ